MRFLADLLQELANSHAMRRAHRVLTIAFEDPGGDWSYNQELKEQQDWEVEEEDRVDDE